MKRIYIAGSLTPKGNRDDCQNAAIEYLLNCRDMIAAGVSLMKKGWAPFCPAQDMLYFLYLRPGESIGESAIKDMSLAWLDASDAILLLPGWKKSRGSIAEFDAALTLGKAIYESLAEVPDETD